MTNEELFQEAYRVHSDTNEHLPKLRELASACGHVTEFGNWTGTSACGLLMGLLESSQPAPRTFVTIDINKDYLDACLKRLSGFERDPKVVTVVGRLGSTLELDIDPTDFLFIDSWHTYTQLSAELDRHASKVRKYLGFHDTVSFGFYGEDGACPGLDAAIDEFLAKHPEWSKVYHVEFNNGLTVLERNQ